VVGQVLHNRHSKKVLTWVLWIYRYQVVFYAVVKVIMQRLYGGGVSLWNGDATIAWMVFLPSRSHISLR
jgi:hypothetical protein